MDGSENQKQVMEDDGKCEPDGKVQQGAFEQTIDDLIGPSKWNDRLPFCLSG